ncbi:hypothetical protein MHU86_19404 [Fragilaria crotonensis]|nr:hypothetical protein MHU86_19404 [Fragilaria crotonensis]
MKDASVVVVLSQLLISPVLSFGSSFISTRGATRANHGTSLSRSTNAADASSHGESLLRLNLAFERFDAADAAMSDFFLANYDWHPVFRSLAVDSTVPAMSFLLETPAVAVDDEGILDTSAFLASSSSSSTFPWKRLEAIPSGEPERQVVAGFLDAMQQALLDIPCVSEEDDEFDAQFIEEGRRMLAVSRFQVLMQECELFSTCWNELFELKRLDQPNTGSLIVLPPGYDVDQLESFTKVNLEQPLEWLGLHTSFEISGITRGNPAVRLLHKLSDIPTQVG